MIRFFYSFCLFLVALAANAARVVDGINYEFDRTNNTATVVALTEGSYSGAIDIRIHCHSYKQQSLLS